MPTPAVLIVGSPPRWNIPKIASRSAHSATPGPRSSTTISAPPSWLSTRTLTSVPSGVCLRAFASRLSTIRSTFGASTAATTGSDFARDSVHTRDPRDELGDVGLRELRDQGAVTESVEIQEIGQEAVESLDLFGQVAEGSRYWPCSISAPRSRSVMAKPRIAVSGVLSSCETVARIVSRSEDRAACAR